MTKRSFPSIILITALTACAPSSAADNPSVAGSPRVDALEKEDDATDGSAAAQAVPAGESLQQAFQAAFGARGEATAEVADEGGEMINITYRPEKLFWLRRGLVLVSIGGDDAPQWRKYAVHYLTYGKGVFKVDKGWLNVGSAGAAASISDKFSAYPMLYSEGIAVGAGGSESWFELAELRPDGPHALKLYRKVDGDAQGEQIGVNGKFAAITNGAFDLRCGSGKIVHFGRVGDSYATSDLAEDEECR